MEFRRVLFRSRVAIATLVARAPELWLLDEPHAGLDAEARDVLDGVIAEAHSRGATVVMASHEVDRAAPLASRLVTMAGGAIVAPPARREAGRPEPETIPVA